MILPVEKNKPKVQNPRFFILFGKPKSGKTTIVSQLDNNLIIDLEGGSEFLECLSLQARSVDELGQIANAITEKTKENLGKVPYKYITIDNATRLEEITLPYALKLYQNTPMGKSFNGDVRHLPNGGGYLYIRLAIRKVIDMFRKLCETLILVGHTKDVMINVDGKELSEMSLDLSGKTANIVCGEADAVAYIYRQKNKTFMDFHGGGNTVVEARAPHLRGKTFVIAEADENNNVVANWEQIFLKEE